MLIGEDAITLMETYGLLPNDAIILATCKFYGVKYLISFDSDFANACESEGISQCFSAVVQTKDL